MNEIFKPFEATGGVTTQQVLAFLVLVAPGFIALRVYDMQRGGEARQAKDLLIWMQRIASESLDLGAIVTLHDGRAVGARIGPFARRASTSDDLLLDEVWTIDENRATLVEPLPRSYAVLMNRADCQMIEFVRLDASAEPSSCANHEVA